MKERNQSIDAIRFLAAILVVCLHVSLPKGQIWSMNVLFVARSAVPLFLMISGYEKTNMENYKNRCAVLSSLYFN